MAGLTADITAGVVVGSRPVGAAFSHTSGTAASFGADSSFYAARLAGDGAASVWRLDETQGGTARDAVGAVHGSYLNGVLLASAGPAPSAPRCARFDGNNDVVMVGQQYKFPGRAPFTVEVTFRLDSYAAKARTLVSNFDYDSGLHGWLLGVHQLDGGPTAGRVEFERWDGTAGDGAYTTSTIATGQWYHLIAVYDGTTMHLYLNGVDTTAFWANTNRQLAASTQPLMLGSVPANQWGQAMDGTLCNVAIYDRALDASTAASHASMTH